MGVNLARAAEDGGGLSGRAQRIFSGGNARWQISILARLPLPWHAGLVNVIVVEVKAGRDGKLYPAGGDLPAAARNQARWLIHNLHCRDGLPIRQAQRVMLAEHGLRRSLGILHRDLANYECPACRDRPG
jgi:hypothetical protein